MADGDCETVGRGDASGPLSGAGSESVSSLFPRRDERERQDDLITRTLLAAGERIAEGSVTPTLDLAVFQRDLAGFDFTAPQPTDALLSWVIAQL